MRILIADDQPIQVRVLERILRHGGYRNIEFETDPTRVVVRCRLHQPDLLLLDLHMPGLEGFEILERLRDSVGFRRLSVLVLTGDISVTARRRALELGARDFVTKPPDPVEILARVRNLLEMRHMQLQLELQNEQLSQRVAEQTRDIEQARQELLDRLALVSELRDYTTGEHTRRVGHTAELLARELLPLDDVRRAIRDAAPLHDIGKIAVPDSVLLKPGPLTDQETLLIRRHVEIGAQILGRSHSTVLRLAQEIALAHHERWDGTGYPSGRAGEEIPIAGRITAVADVFDALTHERPYKEALPVADAVRLIEHEAGRQFDPQVVAAFARLDHARLV